MKKMMLLMTLVMSFLLTSCGGERKKIVTDFNLETRDQDDQKFVVSDFQLDLGSAELPFLHLPLPKDYGYVRLYRLNGMNHVALDVNLSEILKLPGGEATLPNGTMLPVDTQGAGVISIPINGINGVVYIAQKDDMTLVGFAISIKQLDGLGNSVGTIGVFPNFDIKNVNVTAGVFSSDGEGKTGIAVFANIGSLWNGDDKELAYYDRNAFPAREAQWMPRWKKRVMARQLIRFKNTQQVLDLGQND
jgi:hypothetical protein